MNNRFFGFILLLALIVAEIHGFCRRGIDVSTHCKTLCGTDECNKKDTKRCNNRCWYELTYADCDDIHQLARELRDRACDNSFQDPKYACEQACQCCRTDESEADCVKSCSDGIRLLCYDCGV